jgi:hypothetical protein
MGRTCDLFSRGETRGCGGTNSGTYFSLSPRHKFGEGDRDGALRFPPIVAKDLSSHVADTGVGVLQVLNHLFHRITFLFFTSSCDQQYQNENRKFSHGA